MTLDDAMKKLTQARKRLEAEQGRIARRNARTAVMAALRSVRAALDEEYPAVRKERKVRVKMTGEAIERRRRRKLARMRPIDTQTAAEFALHKIPVEVVHQKTKHGQPLSSSWYVDAWVLRARRVADIKLVAEAVRSPKARKKIEAMLRLGGAHP